MTFCGQSHRQTFMKDSKCDVKLDEQQQFGEHNVTVLCLCWKMNGTLHMEKWLWYFYQKN